MLGKAWRSWRSQVANLWNANRMTRFSMVGFVVGWLAFAGSMLVHRLAHDWLIRNAFRHRLQWALLGIAVLGVILLAISGVVVGITKFRLLREASKKSGRG